MPRRNLAATKREKKPKVSDAAIEYIRTFRDKPRMVNYIQVKWQERDKTTWLKWHLIWARSTGSIIIKTPKRPANIWRVGRAAKKLFEFNRKIVEVRRQQHFFRVLTATELTAMHYVYFPLHKETDLPVNFQAAAWFD